MLAPEAGLAVGDLRRSPGLSERDHLLLGDAPLTVVVAPAGFGKTTVLNTWRARTPSSVYGTFDAFYRTGARDAGLVLARCARELTDAEDAVAEAMDTLTGDKGGGLGAEFVAELARVLREISGPYVCFLDDLHGLSEEVCRDVGRLIGSVADQRHRFVVASRTELPWPVERWRVAGFAATTTTDELRLTPDEIARLLPPDATQLAPVAHRVTEGWPAAVRMISRRLAADPNPDLDIEAEMLDLVNYVTAEMIPELSDTELRVLTRTSILQPFPASVAITVSGEAVAPGVLLDARERTSLVGVLDDGHYSFHPVLRAALQQQLAYAEPGLDQQLHKRAAEAWLDEPDSFTALSNALDHLIAARAWTEAIDLLGQRLVEIEQHGQLDRFVEWVDLIPGRWWRHDTAMVLQYSYARLRIGRPALPIGSLRAPDTGGTSHAAAVAKLTYAWMTGWTTDPQEALRLCAQAVPLRTLTDQASEPRWVPSHVPISALELTAQMATAEANAMLGRWDRAIEGLHRVLQHRSDVPPIQLPVVHGTLSYSLAARGDVADARAHAEQALQVAADAGLVAHHVRTVPALLGLATVAAMTGDPEGALTTLQCAAERCRPSRAANLLALCGQVAALSGASHSYLADIDPPLTPASIPIVEQFTTAAAARDLSRLGDHAGAERLLRSTEAHELTLGTWVEILLHRAERRSVRRWLARLDKPTTTHARIVRLLAEATVAEGPSDTSRRTVEAAGLASEGHLVGVLMNAPVQLWQPLDADRSPHPMIIETLAKLDGPTLLTEQLTSRELEVLRLLPHVGTTGELAARLFVSENTANWHRRNIYRKLGVHRRQEAVARGAELRLITAVPA
ncbi:MAG: LuxR C-terminal-related transcriptional regulator [Micropruina sp.]